MICAKKYQAPGGNGKGAGKDNRRAQSAGLRPPRDRGSFRDTGGVPEVGKKLNVRVAHGSRMQLRPGGWDIRRGSHIQHPRTE